MSSSFAVFIGALRENRRRVMLWFVAMFVVCAMYAAWYPLMRDSGKDLVQSLPQDVIKAFNWEDVVTAPGYLTSTIFALIAPGLASVFAIGLGAKIVAGEEEDGTLELELTAPVARRSLVLQRVLALWMSTFIVVAAVCATSLLQVGVLRLDVSVENVLAGSAGLLLLVMGFGTVALAAGAMTGRRGIGLGIGSAVAVLSYMLNSVGEVLQADWMLTVSPFAWFLGARPLFDGFDWTSLAALAAVSIVAAAVAVVGYERRNLMT